MPILPCATLVSIPKLKSFSVHLTCYSYFWLDWGQSVVPCLSSHWAKNRAAFMEENKQIFAVDVYSHSCTVKPVKLKFKLRKMHIQNILVSNLTMTSKRIKQFEICLWIFLRRYNLIAISVSCNVTYRKFETITLFLFL